MLKSLKQATTEVSPVQFLPRTISRTSPTAYTSTALSKKGSIHDTATALSKANKHTAVAIYLSAFAVEKKDAKDKAILLKRYQNSALSRQTDEILHANQTAS